MSTTQPDPIHHQEGNCDAECSMFCHGEPIWPKGNYPFRAEFSLSCGWVIVDPDGRESVLGYANQQQADDVAKMMTYAYQQGQINPIRQEPAESFLKSCLLDTRGRIVSASDLTVHQICEAQVYKRWFVTDDGLGFAVLPWNLTTDMDRAREHGWDNINKAIPPTYTDGGGR